MAVTRPVHNRDSGHGRRRLAAVVVALLVAALLPMVASAPAAAAPADPKAPWTRVSGKPAAAKGAHRADIKAKRLAAHTLDRAALTSQLSKAHARAAGPLVISLPTPAGGFQRFTLVDSPVMEAGLAAKHPEITTYAGKGIDDPTATIRADLTPLGFHASVRSPHGAWYIDPYYNQDQSLYASYYGRDLTDDHGEFVEREDVTEAADALSDEVAAVAGAPVSLRTYRVALVTDPSYATFFGAANVTAAKVTLMNRVTQVYEDETAIRLVLINDTDKTNLNTAALATEPNGPCGASACFTPAQLTGCTGGTLNRNRIVLGQLVGASNYDVGHLGLGVAGGGVAGLGVVGGDGKARGCTGLPTPVGDFYAVDYVAHEMGHQFAGNHTFNGTQLNCSGGNRSAANSVEPGSGSSIMAYAGICRQDDLQPHSDPYWSQRSFTEITTYVTSARPAINEVQTVSLRDFDTDGDSFTLDFGGVSSAPIVRGTSYTLTDIDAAVEAVVGAPVTVAAFGGTGALTDVGFQVTFGGAANVAALGLTFAGASGFVGETAKGGPIDNGGNVVELTGNHAPVVTVPAAVTIPVRTPFALTGSATDAEGDTLTYLWEQNDRGGSSGGSTVGTALVNNVKTNGPLFRQFGTAAIVSPTDTLEYYSPGENAVSTDPTRVFPDLAQIAAGNTNAVTGTCPPAPPPPTSGGSNVPADVRDCYSEFLPTADWVGFDNDRTMHFRLTARDGHSGGGGVANADVAVTLAPAAGPFLVTSQSAATTLEGGTPVALSWDVAGTDAAPVNAADVRISLSVDGGATFPHVLAASTANDGTESVTLPNVGTTRGRIKIEAVGNIFFDLNDADLTINAAPVVSSDAPGGVAQVQYSDALSPRVTVRATDADTAGSALTATAVGLPAGMSLAVASTSGDSVRPGARTWTVAGAATAAPGSYPVTVTVSDSTGVAGTTSFTIVVVREDAEVTYTGDTLASAGTVVLRATVRDGAALAAPTDRAPGDVRNATVTFTEGGTTLCTAPVGLVGTAFTVGSASCAAPLSLGSHTITVSVGGYYVGSDTGLVTVARSAGSITGSGTIRPLKSAGVYPARLGSQVDLTPKSPTTVRFQSGSRTYEIRTTAIESLGSSAAGGVTRADLRAKANLNDVTTSTPTLVASGLTLQVTVSDRGSPGSADSFAVTLWNGSTLLFSSEWTGAKSQELRLTGGNLVVR
ncbi:Putative Ig domain-containing protein [Asanoa hainanensis]|uniref:Putative Ig domain-containing protein n=1 Tax=Asanoa hainanensis TaxID=560556 RepID=A0A239FVR2_9ACTN|nr:M12 family metallo-peptidase [Asanoa hainanensis]SNS60313.1 Putative Ig domain-containing protein [Asanoa hainanensis]